MADEKPEDEHIMKAGIEEHGLDDLHKQHPLHEKVTKCTCLGMPGSDPECKVHAE